jgi:hypothetical protein
MRTTQLDHLRDAVLDLHRSTEAERSMMRRDCCLSAARHLRLAGLYDYSEHAAALGEAFHGDGRGVSRLLDELTDLLERVGEFGPSSGFSLRDIVAGLTCAEVA